jgi:hypothetical protein
MLENSDVEKTISVDLTILEAIGAWKCIKLMVEMKVDKKDRGFLPRLLEKIHDLTEIDMMIFMSAMTELAEKIDEFQKENKDGSSGGVLPDNQVRPVQ